MTNPARLHYLLGRITRTAVELVDALPLKYEEFTRDTVHGVLLWCREARGHGATTEQLTYAINSGLAQAIRSDSDLIPGLSPSEHFTGVLDIAADHLVFGLEIGHRTYRVHAHEHTPFQFTRSREYLRRRATEGPLPTAEVTFTIYSDTHPVTAVAHANVGPELVPALRAISRVRAMADRDRVLGQRRHQDRTGPTDPPAASAAVHHVSDRGRGFSPSNNGRPRS